MRPDAHLWIRPDAYRFMPPGSPLYTGRDVVKYFWPDPQPDQPPHYGRKYSPDQPRVPAGNPDGGQWTDEGGDSGFGGRVVLASLIPRVPKNRPPTTPERNRIARELARLGSGSLAAAIAEGATWLAEFAPIYFASFDPPKTFAELQSAVSHPRPGYDIHHIVERATAAADGSEDRLISAPENLVRIPRWKHWDLNKWYESENEEFERMTPRNYLRGKSWEERDRVGLKGLLAIGVLKQ
jgi:hypothetical protein